MDAMQDEAASLHLLPEDHAPQGRDFQTFLFPSLTNPTSLNIHLRSLLVATVC